MRKVTFKRGMNLSVPSANTRGFFQPGDTVALPDEYATRLINGGLARPAEGPTVSRPVMMTTREDRTEITARPAARPEWRGMSWQQKRSLAATLTDTPIRNMADADRILKKHYG